MITLIVPAHLARLMPDLVSSNGRRSLSVRFDATNWPELTDEMRARYPLLTERVLTDAGTLGPGFVLVVNDQAVPAHRSSANEVSDGDEVAIIVALAGG